MVRRKAVVVVVVVVLKASPWCMTSYPCASFSFFVMNHVGGLS